MGSVNGVIARGFLLCRTQERGGNVDWIVMDIVCTSAGYKYMGKMTGVRRAVSASASARVSGREEQGGRRAAKVDACRTRSAIRASGESSRAADLDRWLSTSDVRLLRRMATAGDEKAQGRWYREVSCLALKRWRTYLAASLRAGKCALAMEGLAWRAHGGASAHARSGRRVCGRPAQNEVLGRQPELPELPVRARTQTQTLPVRVESTELQSAVGRR